ncbi:hypothetical protein [Paenibacillus wynnii]|uniref:hypothetical protein n=1 Tax=Paenibacillus wynnii TaxID=268407 RepID=UPI0027D84221|nr:hypothetical protein [Paenibacillus wynnii]
MVKAGEPTNGSPADEKALISLVGLNNNRTLHARMRNTEVTNFTLLIEGKRFGFILSHKLTVKGFIVRCSGMPNLIPIHKFNGISDFNLQFSRREANLLFNGSVILGKRQNRQRGLNFD